MSHRIFGNKVLPLMTRLRLAGSLLFTSLLRSGDLASIVAVLAAKVTGLDSQVCVARTGPDVLQGEIHVPEWTEQLYSTRTWSVCGRCSQISLNELPNLVDSRSVCSWHALVKKICEISVEREKLRWKRTLSQQVRMPSCSFSFSVRSVPKRFISSMGLATHRFRVRGQHRESRIFAL